MPVDIVVQDVPQPLRKKIVATAKTENVSINEVAVRTLADAFGVEREPSGRPYRGEQGSTQLLLVVPDELRTAIRMSAARNGATMRGTVIEVLSEKYGLKVETTGRRPRTRAA